MIPCCLLLPRVTSLRLLSIAHRKCKSRRQFVTFFLSFFLSLPPSFSPSLFLSDESSVFPLAHKVASKLRRGPEGVTHLACALQCDVTMWLDGIFWNRIKAVVKSKGLRRRSFIKYAVSIARCREEATLLKDHSTRNSQYRRATRVISVEAKSHEEEKKKARDQFEFIITGLTNNSPACKSLESFKISGLLLLLTFLLVLLLLIAGIFFPTVRKRRSDQKCAPLNVTRTLT